MDDIQKIRETRTKDAGDWEEWPYPTVEIESVITGKLRSRMLGKLNYPANAGEIHLIETQASEGYSEYTQEDECSIEVKVGSEVAWSAEYESSADSAMARFLKEFAGDAT